MTKADIINRISEEQGIDRKTVALVIEGFMKCVKDALGRRRISNSIPDSSFAYLVYTHPARLAIPRKGLTTQAEMVYTNTRRLDMLP